ncbi:MAG TPA: hypothetical protein PKA10_15355 [Selenomonadales bacterium]|nr:hypothetical protein [Selenomonadales bacterium]
MRKVALAVLIAALLAACLPPAAMAQRSPQEIKVVVAYHPDYLKQAPHILKAYESVLQEEGVPYQNMDVFQLVETDVDDFVNNVPAIILPDYLLQNLPLEFDAWIRRYLEKGGNIAAVYDPGIRNDQGFFLNRAVLADLTGVNYITYNTLGPAAYDVGNVQFSSEAGRDFFQIPPGKTIDRLTISSYGYGKLQYPIARTQPVYDIPEKNIYAYGITKAQEKIPLIVLSDYAAGKVLYVNLPLGHLKGVSEDLLIRSTLRTFLFDVVAVPHVMNVENGRGVIVINWHVDSKVERISLPVLQRAGYLRKAIAASYDITAGDFMEKPGDHEGFSADGRGRKLVQLLAGYGTIGSHGGWAHNWFSDNILSGKFKEAEIREYIAKNNESLEKIVGYKITEYAAPNGVHPQPMATKILEDLGVIAYYYTGDTGSAPNRAFFQGQMVSDKVIAFPIMPNGKSASLWEMRAHDKRTDAEINEWLLGTLDYIARNRVVRLVYSHPYNIQNYPQAVEAFLDKVEAMQADQRIATRSMSDYAAFLLRFLATTYTFTNGDGKLAVSLKNPADLTGLTVALPKKAYRRPSGDGFTVQEDERYYYLTVVKTDEKEKYITVDGH